MTKLAVIGDVHGHMTHLERVMEAIEAEDGVSGILLVGDLGVGLHNSNLQHPGKIPAYTRSVQAILDRVHEAKLPTAWVPGNHDLQTPDIPPPKPDDGHLGNIDFTVANVGGLQVAGIGGAGPARFGFPYEWGEDDIRGRQIPACDVVLSHTPPADTPLDRVPGRGIHVGSQAVRELAAQHTGFLVCGHIHESPSAVQIGNCLCLNVGGLGHPFGRPQLGFIAREGGLDLAWHLDLITETRQQWRRVEPH